MLDNDAIDAELGEMLFENEDDLIRQTAEVISIIVRDGPRPAVRDAHPKAHGCVRAEFRISDHLPPELAQGVFKPGTTYPAYIRFSNGNPEFIRRDGIRDVRGMAIKLMSVPGDKILLDERNAQTQDFIMVNHPVFFADDIARYLKFFERQVKPGWFGKLPALSALGVKGAYNLIAMASSKIASPLETRYWSQVPYRLGDLESPHKKAIKFRASPRLSEGKILEGTLPEGKLPIHPKIPNYPPHFLREAMVAQLCRGDAQFDFEVQLGKLPSMRVEDSMTEWKAKDAPFIKVATITIPGQTVVTPERVRFGENLSFTPWHALPQHRPLGAVNRVRRVVYETISKLRHELNGTERREPTSFEA